MTDTTSTTAAKPRYMSRVVDRDGQGWWTVGHDGRGELFTTTVEFVSTHPELEHVAREELEAARGPLREVVAMPTEDSDALKGALTAAGPKAMATVMVALNQTAQRVVATTGTSAALVAGRPGSWEASRIRHLAWEGDSISSTRVDPAALDVLTQTLERWVLGDTPVELAENLAYVLSSVAGHAGGWAKITDRWVRGASYAEALEGWAMSQSSVWP